MNDPLRREICFTADASSNVCGCDYDDEFFTFMRSIRNYSMNIVAKLDAAASLGKRISIHYRDAPPCDQIPYYGEAPAPYYVMLLP